MIRRKEHTWQQKGSRNITSADQPAVFLEQQTAPLFFVETFRSAGHEKALVDEREFWKVSYSSVFGSVCLDGFRLSSWFPRAPGVFWSRAGVAAREETYGHATTTDPELGVFFSPRSKMNLIEKGGFGTIRLRPRRIDNTDCWLGTAVKGTQLAGGVPLVIPHYFLTTSQTFWSDTVRIWGQVRFVQDAGLLDVASAVHHCSPLIIFVEKIESVPRRKKLDISITLSPVVLFDEISSNEENFRWNDRGYTFVQTNSDDEEDIGSAANWIEQYVDKHKGRIITNFDEISPIMAEVPLSYQRLVAKNYDRTVIKNLYFHGEKLAERIDAIGNANTEYNNFGQVAAFGENAQTIERKT